MSRDRYEEAGVGLHRAERIVSRHASHINATMQPGFHGKFGSFGAGIDLSALDLGELTLKDLLLVSTADGVGTKVMLAHEEDWHEGIGEDCVAMCTNDVWAMGARPLWFMDYIGMNALDEERIAQVMTGMARACAREQCMLVGGETAEMPGTYTHEEGYELAGFCVGGMSRHKVWDEEPVQGDWIVGFASSGIHSNGFSLVRHGVACGEVDLSELLPDGRTLRQELLIPTRQYGEALRTWQGDKRGPRIKRASHITGGGLVRGMSRLCEGAQMEWEASKVEEPTGIGRVREMMGIAWEQAAEVWNMGVGFVVVCEGRHDKADLDAWCMTLSEEAGYRIWVQGRLT